MHVLFLGLGQYLLASIIYAKGRVLMGKTRDQRIPSRELVQMSDNGKSTYRYMKVQESHEGAARK